jgi:hypothetical protein
MAERPGEFRTGNNAVMQNFHLHRHQNANRKIELGLFHVSLPRFKTTPEK